MSRSSFVAVFSLAVIGCGAAEPVNFTREIAPILVAQCQICHNPGKARGRYQLHTFEALLQPGASQEPPVVPGKPEESLLLALLATTNEDERMPQDADPLSSPQVGLIRRWISEGAGFDGPDPKTPLAELIPREPSPEAPVQYSRPAPILALAFHPDGREIAVNGYHEVTIWNAETGELIRRLPQMPERIQSLCYSADGALLAVAGGQPGRSGAVLVADAASGSMRMKSAPLNDLALDVQFHPAAPLVVAGGADSAIRIYDLNTGRQERVIEEHADWVMALAFNTNGTKLASASRDKTARVYDFATGELESAYTGHEAPVAAIAFLDGKRMASAGRDRKIHLWDAEEEAKKAAELFVGQDILRFVTDGSALFAACADGKAREYRLSNRTFAGDLSGHTDRVYALAAHFPAKRLASGSHNGEVRIWNMEDRSLIKAFIAAPGFSAQAAGASPAR